MSFENEADALAVAISDETTDITVGAAKVTMQMPYNFSLSKVIAGLSVASSSGLPTFNVKKNAVTIFSTKPTIDVNETSSLTAATPSVLSVNPTLISAGDTLTFDVDVAGTGAKGAKIYLLGNIKGPF